MKRIVTLLFAVGLAMAMSSCSHTALTATWHDLNEPPAKMEKIGIVVMVPSKANRGTIETALANQFKMNGINAISTMGIFPNAGQLPEGEIDRDEIEARVKDKVEKNKLDGILIVSLRDTKEESYYIEGSPTYVGTPYYGGFGRPYAYPITGYPYYDYSYYNYYSYHYSTIYSPGYYVNTTTYYVESSLFGIESGKMLWSAQSETTDPVSITRESETFAELIVNQVLSDRAIAQ